MKKKLLFILSLLIFLPSPAYAYLDPGLGSLIIQSIIGSAAVALGIISVYWQKAKDMYFKFIFFFKRKKSNHIKKKIK